MKIIKFIHKAPEHKKSLNKNNDVTTKTGFFKNWNSSEHLRKFVVHNGTILENEKESDIKQIMFWCEWEPPSLVTKQLQTIVETDLPKYLHTELYNPELPNNEQDLDNCKVISNDNDKYYQNTDPCVFGSQFNYFVCLQARHQDKDLPFMVTTELTKLDKGSIILFGSKISNNNENKFVLDTLFVVNDWIDYYSLNDLLETKNTKISKEYINIALQFLGKSTYDYKRRLYFGATYSEKDKNNGMYSFVPCQIYKNSNQGFERPSLDLGNINYAHNQGFMFLVNSSNVDKIKEFWLNIKQQVEKTCEIGLSFQMPLLQDKYTLENKYNTKI